MGKYLFELMPVNMVIHGIAVIKGIKFSGFVSLLMFLIEFLLSDAVSAGFS